MANNHIVKKKVDKDCEYHRHILDQVLAQKDKGRIIGTDKCWFAQIGPCVAMVQFVEGGGGGCWDEMKLWPVESFTGQNRCCRPCFEIRWSDDSITVETYQPGNWEKELLGFLGNQLKRREREIERHIDNDAY